MDDDGSNQLQIAITIAQNGMKNKLEPLMVELGQTVCRTCIAMKLNPDRYTDDTRITKWRQFGWCSFANKLIVETLRGRRGGGERERERRKKKEREGARIGATSEHVLPWPNVLA